MSSSRSNLASTVYECLRKPAPMGVDAFRRGVFEPACAMAVPRAHHSATAIAGGGLLVVGGMTADGSATDTAEYFDPHDRVWAPVPRMGISRIQHTATLLRCGSVLAVGGTRSGGVMDVTSQAEAYDPTTQTWKSLSPMAWPRARHAATLLDDGRVLVTGGCAPGRVLADAEIYDPARDSWSPVAPMRGARVDHTLTTLGHGRVLAVGRSSGLGGASEIYDIASNRWAPTGRAMNHRSNHRTTMLADGRVLVTGGIGEQSGSVGAAEIFYPQWQSWGDADVHYACDTHGAVALEDGGVILAGGLVRTGSSSASRCVQHTTLFDSVSSRWVRGPAMLNVRFGHTATLLPYCGIVVVGGQRAARSTPMGDCELLCPNWEALAGVR